MPIPVNFPNMVMTLLWMKNKGIILVRTGQMRAIIVVQWCSMQGGWNMTRFNSLSLKLTTVYCVCLSLCSWPKGPNCGIVRIGVKNLWSGPIDAVLSLSANCKPLLSAGQSDAEAPWWIQACGGYKSVSSGVCPYIQSAQRSTHTSTHTRTHAHIPAERFSLGSHLSHFVPQTHLWFAGEKNNNIVSICST